MSERPLLTVSESGTDGSIYANREGLEQLRAAIDKVLAGSREEKIVAFRGGDGWHEVTVHLSSQEDFSGEEGACMCGCQKKYEGVEAAYRRQEAGSP